MLMLAVGSFIYHQSIYSSIHLSICLGEKLHIHNGEMRWIDNMIDPYLLLSIYLYLYLSIVLLLQPLSNIKDFKGLFYMYIYISQSIYLSICLYIYLYIIYLSSGERHRTMVRLMENMLSADPLLDMDINPYNLPEVLFFNDLPDL